MIMYFSVASLQIGYKGVQYISHAHAHNTDNSLVHSYEHFVYTAQNKVFIHYKTNCPYFAEQTVSA